VKHISECLGITEAELEELAGIYERSPQYAANEKRRAALAANERREWQLAMMNSAIDGVFGDKGKDTARDYTALGQRIDDKSLDLFSAEMQRLSAAGLIRRRTGRW